MRPAVADQRAGVPTDICSNGLVERRRIEIRPGFGSGQTHVDALVYGDWATHQHLDVPGLWVLTILPLGLNLPPDWCSFPTEEQAIAAMIDVARLRNSWCVVTQADFTAQMTIDLKAIAAKHGAVEGPLGAAAQADHNRLGRRMATRPNGYGAALG